MPKVNLPRISTYKWPTPFSDQIYDGGWLPDFTVTANRISIHDFLSPTYNSTMADAVSNLFGKPYKFGANGPYAYDCSSSVCHGIRDVNGNFGDYSANDLFRLFTRPANGNIGSGTLKFYDWNGNGEMQHVTTLLDQNSMLHASKANGILEIRGINYLNHYSLQTKIYFRNIIWSLVFGRP